MLNVLNWMLRNEFECWNNGIAQSHHHSSLNWMTVLQTCCIFCEFERHKFRFDWRKCQFECWENEIEWQIGCAWPKSSKLNAHNMNLVDKITKLTGKTYKIYACNNVMTSYFVFHCCKYFHSKRSGSRKRFLMSFSLSSTNRFKLHYRSKIN